jgi:thiazole/oxazole-forming peptide maturase SagC family component
MVGYIGPLVIPGDTACLECLRARQNACLTNATERRVAERGAFDGQRVTAYHPAMVGMVAEAAAFELIRFYAALPQWKVGRLIELNLLSTAMAHRKVLKAPRCPVCSSLHAGVPTSLHKMIPLTAIQNR